MTTAIAAYTPNAPWALMGCGLVVGFGGGTSSATPQAAGAAALWLQAARFPTGFTPWQHVEAVRSALFASADRSVSESDKYFGRGILKAAAALDQPVPADSRMCPPDEVSFPWLRELGVLEAMPTGADLMYEVEALQVFLQTPALQALVGGADPMSDRLTPAETKSLIEAMRQSPKGGPAASRSTRQDYRPLGK